MNIFEYLFKPFLPLEYIQIFVRCICNLMNKIMHMHTYLFEKCFSMQIEGKKREKERIDTCILVATLFLTLFDMRQAYIVLLFPLFPQTY